MDPAGVSFISQPDGGRKLQLQQCLERGYHYLYRSDNEYLVNDSKDEEYLTRLAAEQAVEYPQE